MKRQKSFSNTDYSHCSAIPTGAYLQCKSQVNTMGESKKKKGANMFNKI